MKCEICDKEISRSVFGHKNICSDSCFTIDFWNTIVEEKEEHLFIDGVSYLAKPYVPNPKNKNWLGCSGRLVYIEKNNGNLIITNDLWCQGAIPESYKDLLPDNARFISKGEYENLMRI